MIYFKDGDAAVEGIKRLMLDELRDAGIDLDDTERSVCYMNGNDGTDFDWDMNDRTCEFMIFYDEQKTGSDYGAIKAYVSKDGGLDGYVYPENYGRGKGIPFSHELMCESDAEEFAGYLQQTRDDKWKWDFYITAF